MKYFEKKITDKWLNEASEDELKRIIIVTNDGQGDTGGYTIKDLKKYENVDDLSIPELIEYFYLHIDGNGNNTKSYYFDEEKGYLNIEWVC